ncbi:M48 family metalloprotease [Thiovibrio sp. JS02]
MKNHALVMAILLAAGCAFFSGGCKTTEVLDSLGGIQVGGFSISESQMDSIKKTAHAMEKAFTDITPEQEYYLGRAVAASLLGRYPVHGDQAASLYLNRLGQTLAEFSDRPETYGGYHFLLIADEGINAFAAPGGLILVSRGMLRCCKDEDQVAAVLAHEIGHVQQKHGLQAIRKSRLTSAFSLMATEGARQLGSPELAGLTDIFENSINDVTATLVNSGYSRAFEREADAAALAILSRAGYDPRALVAMLGEMEARLQPKSLDFAKTHPDPTERIEELAPLLASAKEASGKALRRKRFQLALAGI